MSSRYIYNEAMKNKSVTEVLKAFKKIYKKSQIRAIRSDNGSEFISDSFKKYLAENGIKQILSEAGKPHSNGMIERSNATIKELIQKSLEINENYDWVKNLQRLIENINSTTHRITGFTPNQIQEAYENDNKELLDEAYNKKLKKKQGNISKQEFKGRDFVRIYLPSGKTRQSWSNEIYEVEKVYQLRKSYSVYEYKLKEFPDRFKEEELHKVDGKPQNKIMNIEKFDISKLITPVIDDDEIYYEVKWKGYKDTTLERRENLIQDVPKMLNQFEKKNIISFYVNRNIKTGEKTLRFHKK